MTTTELTTITPASFELGSRDTIKEIADRMRKMMPNAVKFTESEALAVAQVAAMNSLDPFNGEVWGIKKDEKWYGVMVGIKGLRRCSSRQARQEETTYWVEFMQVDGNKYGATKPGSLVFEAHLRDTVKVQAWGKSLNILTTAGVPYKEAVLMIGSCPEVVGIGIADPSEYSKMGLGQRAKKRAEADALKQRFQVSFGAGVISEGEKLDDATAEAASEAENVITGVVVDEPERAPVIDERLQAFQAACEMTTPMGRRLRDFNDSQLEALGNNKQASEEIKAAARLVLDYRIETALHEAQIQKELGFGE